MVPVGADQVAHLELTREIIRRFNHLYKANIPEPKPLLTETPLVPGLDGRKMSKSYNNGLLMSETAKDLEKKIKQMITDPQRARREDPGNPEVCTVYKYHLLVSSEEEKSWVVLGCTTAGIGCGDCKNKLFGNLNQLMEKARLRKKELLNNPQELDSIIDAGCTKAQEEARRTMLFVREKMKFYSARGKL
jgi:tryptophanyl-tRNA synthetase